MEGVQKSHILPIKKSEVHTVVPYDQCCHHRCDTIQTERNLLIHLCSSRISHVGEVGKIKVHMVRTWLHEQANKG
jgi:hypothetical protein